MATLLGKDKFAITPFAGENFSAWSFRLKSILKDSQVHKAIEVETFSELVENETLESKAQAIIIAAVADSHLEYLRGKDTAFAMYKNLEFNFEKKGTRSKLFLRRKLNDMKYNERDKLLEHFVKMEEIFTQLKNADSEVSEEEKVNYILLSMPKSYENVVTALETIENLKYDFVKIRLLSEEEKRKRNKDSESRNVSSAFLCYACGKPGHKKYECSETNNRMRFQLSRGFNRASTSNFGQHQQSEPTYRNNYKQGIERQHPTTRGRGRGSERKYSTHFTETDKSVFLCNESNESFVCENNSKNNIEWYIDSGCSDHLTNNKNYFTDYLELKKPKLISAAKNGIVLQAIGIGNIEVKCYVQNNVEYCTIKNVLYVPDLRKNLLSVSKMEGNGMKVVFSNGNVKVFNDMKNGRLIMIGYNNKNGSLYTVKMEIIKNNYCSYSERDNKDELLKLWHRRYGHLSISNMNILLQRKLVHGLEDIEDCKTRNILCEQCIMGKMTRQPFNKKGHRAIHALELVHSDVCGPLNPTTWDGYNYFVTFIDDYTHFVVVYLIKHKSEVYEKFKNYYNYATKHFQRDILKLRTDNGGEYVSNELKQFCDDRGIIVQHTVAYNPEMNGVAERMNRTLVDKARTLLIESNVKKELWGEAILYSAYVTNRSPTTSKNKTPSELWENRKPNVKNMRVFGSLAYAHIPKQLRYKLDPKGKKLIMVGYCLSGYKLWDEEIGKTVAARNVIFDERLQKQEEYIGIISSRNDERDSVQLEQIDNCFEENDQEVQEENEKHEATTNQREEENTGKRIRRKPIWHNDYITDFNNEDEEAYLAYCLLTQSETPVSYEEAMDKSEWKEAVQKELEALTKLETWEEVTLPKNKKAIDTRWVFKVKEDGTRKARLVARGFQIKKEGPLDIVYSPVARMSTVRMLISKAVQENLQIHQLDIPTAFLNGKLKSEIYIKIPQGVDSKCKNTVMKLKRALYGLTESPKCWNNTISDFAQEKGFKRSEYDFCLYYKKDCWMLIYVDDILIIGKNTTIIEDLKKQFHAKDLGQVKDFLGMEFEMNQDTIIIKQEKLINKILEKFRMTTAKGAKTPMETNLNSQVQEESKTIKVPYRELIGSLMYLTVTTRPDLSFSVSYLSRYLDKPTEQLWNAGKRVLRYLVKTKDKGLIFRKSIDTNLYAYSDSDWAGDRKDRKSVSGALIFHGMNPVQWHSKKQNCVALSTAESEYIAASLTAQELLNLIGIRKHLGQIGTAQLLVDNRGAICMIKSYENSKRTKHIDIKVHFIKDLAINEVIIIKYIETENNYADLMTKSLCKQKFYNFVNHFLL